MQFPHPYPPLIDATIDRRSDGQSPANDGTDACEEAREGLGAFFSIDDFHGGDVLFFWGGFYVVSVVSGGRGKLWKERKKNYGGRV